MKSILKPVEHELVIKKSTFIAYVYPVAFSKDIDHILSALRTKYPDASHHCFAYVLGEQGDQQKADDDGEPSQTAGMPILEVLKKQGLTDLLCVVIRYYGGIKLGAGGLVRAYAKSTSEALKKATYATRVKMLTLQINTTFPLLGSVESYLRSVCDISDIIYEDTVTFVVEVKEADYPMIESRIRDLTSGASYPDIIREYNQYQ